MDVRKKLEELNQTRMRFAGTFERFGVKTNSYTGYQEKTVLLKGIVRTDTGETVTDHLWFNLTKGFQSLGEIQPGDVVEFDARVTTYKKGYWGYNWERQIDNPPGIDYKLGRPTKFTKKEATYDHAPTP